MRSRKAAASIVTLSVLLLTLLVAAPAQAAPKGDSEPVPIPATFPGTPFHVLAPGPTDAGFMGTNVEPSVITNYRGFTAYAVAAGSATDGDGNPYDMVIDMRIFQGEYIASDGTHHRGTFGFIWVDLFEPGSGSQVHDFNAGVAPSGLFWTVRIPDSAVSRGAQSVTMSLQDVDIVDSFQFGGPNEIPATVSFDITWTAAGEVRHLRPGSSDPTDPTNLAGEFRTANVLGTFSGSNSDGFTFSGTAGQSLFSELGTERNGSFLNP